CARGYYDYDEFAYW
nr:immunoglobulin heavy chain junction region [Mus musculus]